MFLETRQGVSRSQDAAVLPARDLWYGEGEERTVAFQLRRHHLKLGLAGAKVNQPWEPSSQHDRCVEGSRHGPVAGQKDLTKFSTAGFKTIGSAGLDKP